MKFIQEYALLIAVATPALVIAGIQFSLFMAGERGTLLLPELRRFPSVDIAEAVKARAPIEALVVACDTNERQLARVARLVAADRSVARDRRALVNCGVEEKRVEKAA